MDSAVGGGGGKVDGRVRGPSDGQDIVGVRFERVEFEGELSNIPEGYCLFISFG